MAMIRLTGALFAFGLLFNLPGAAAPARGSGLAPGEHDIDLGDVRLHYVVRGDGPLLFVTSPGWGIGSGYLQSAIAPLEDTMTLVYIDTRGSGGSGRPADPSQMTQSVMADDIDRLREKLGLDSIDLLGHSDGGTIGIEYAVRHPEHLHKLVLVAPAVLGDREEGATAEYLKLWADDPEYRDAVKAATEEWSPNLTDDEFGRLLTKLMPLYLSDPPRYAADVAKMTKTLRLSSFARSAQGEAAKKANRDQTKDVGAIRAATLILNGTVDWICPYQVAQRLHAAIPDSELRLYANKGHLLWLEAPSRFFEDVRSFLAH
jgi:proline iminopeptidase